MAEVIVVGGGVIGCAVAERLARDGHLVTLFERDRLGGQASGGAAGLLAPHSEAGSSDRFGELALRSHQLYPELVARLETDSGIAVEYEELGSLRVAMTAAEKDRLRALAGQSAEIRWVDGEESRRLEPGLTAEVHGGLLFREAHLAPRRLVAALARTASKAGARILEGVPVHGLLARSGRIEGLQVPGQTLAADWVVLAAGPWTPELAFGLELEIDVAPRRGQLVTLAPSQRALQGILTWEGSYLVPKPDGTVVAGSTEEAAGFDARPTAGGVAGLLRFAVQCLPGLAGSELRGAWAGLRPVTSSGLPLIGPVAGYENLVLATGHHRNGIPLAPVTAEIVASGLGGSWERV